MNENFSQSSERSSGTTKTIIERVEFIRKNLFILYPQKFDEKKTSAIFVY